MNIDKFITTLINPVLRNINGIDEQANLLNYEINIDEEQSTRDMVKIKN